MYDETPGHRIRAKRDQLGISSARLGEVVDLSERTISKIETGILPIQMVDEAILHKIAAQLRTTTEYILNGELQSERVTREEMMRMREEGVLHSNEELMRLDKLAAESIRQRNNASIPLNRPELLILLEVMRGSDGYSP